MLTIERLKEALWFNAEEGRFYWNCKVKGIRIGTQAGSVDAHGYGQIRIDREIYKEHRLVWLYVTGAWPKDQIDHQNHIRRDNRFENLREADNHTNHMNRPMQSSNTSGFVGVSYCSRTKCFAAYITVDGKQLKLGRHKTLEAAIAARKAANERYGYHPNHGIGTGVPQKVSMSSKRGRPSHKPAVHCAAH
jgi:hypothetical protein